MSIQYRSPSAFLSFPFLLFVFAFPSQYCSATDTLTQSQQVSVGQTLISSSQIVELGFFSPGNSSKQYVGIWYKNIPLSACKVVWVASRENPLTATDSTSSLTIGKDGNLRLLDGMRNTVWWTNVSFHSNNSIAVLSDKGDFILRDNVLGLTIWESFTYPCDTFTRHDVGLNTKTGENRFLSSWLTEDDPSPGKFVCGFTPDAPQQAFIWNGSQPYWRGGPWDGWKFIGVRDTNMGYADGFNLLPDYQLGSAYLALVTYNASYFKIMVLTPAGSLEIMEWNEEMKNPNASCVAPANPRDIYGVCGPFGACNKDGSPICECLKGFVPESTQDWKKGNWTGGCVRQTELLCQKNVSSLASGKAKNDGFWNMSKVKLPDHFEYLYDKNYSECQQWCLSNCSCVAYAYVSGIGCMVWAGGLIDI